MDVRLVCALAMAAGVMGCAPSNDRDDDMVTRTIVSLNGTAAPVVRTMTITSVQRDSEIAARMAARSARTSNGLGVAQEAISVDGSCADSSLWLFSGTVAQNGGSYEICFSGQGYTSLGSYIQHLNLYPQPATYWNYHVGSFWPGSTPGGEDGYFDDGGGLCHTDFHADDNWTDTSWPCAMNKLDLTD